MPTLGKPAVILVRPRNPGNIGSAARVMANFGFFDLRIVSPHPPIWQEALKLAADSKSLVRRAKVYKSVAEAVEDRTRVYGTSNLKNRASSLPVRSLPGFVPARGAAFLFGPENNGLFEEDLEYCDEVLTIPTSKSRPSLNLAQAVAVVCYECGVKNRKGLACPKDSFLPSKGIERLVRESEKAFAKIRYRPMLTSRERRAKIRKILHRRGVNKVEGGLLSEVLRRILEL